MAASSTIQEVKRGGLRLEASPGKKKIVRSYLKNQAKCGGVRLLGK
jgi:hypothetical protein